MEKAESPRKVPILRIELQECFLGQVFGLGYVAQHAQAQGVDPALVQAVQALKRGPVAGLGSGNRLCLAGNRRIAPHVLIGALTLGRCRRGAFGRWGKDAIGYGFCHFYTCARQPLVMDVLIVVTQASDWGQCLSDAADRRWGCLGKPSPLASYERGSVAKRLMV